MAAIVTDALFNGSVLALIALGYALAYSVTRTFNFAQPLALALGSSAVIWLQPSGRPWWLTLVMVSACAALAMTTIGSIAQAALPARDGDLRAMLASVAAFAAASWVFGQVLGAMHQHPWLERSGPAGLRLPILFGHAITRPQAAIALCIAALIATFAVIRGSRIGAAMRAVADDDSAALACGINVGAVQATTYALAGVL
ncbi:MAG TPA: hypothetical protein VEJ20_03050, partial [Candidatus Eremiobacteraceae bacterium]|nr:hypothetical protein [Candidatus Eremiobacteraceae bacterium]